MAKVVVLFRYCLGFFSQFLDTAIKKIVVTVEGKVSYCQDMTGPASAAKFQAVGIRHSCTVFFYLSHWPAVITEHAL